MHFICLALKKFKRFTVKHAAAAPIAENRLVNGNVTTEYIRGSSNKGEGMRIRVAAAHDDDGNAKRRNGWRNREAART